MRRFPLTCVALILAHGVAAAEEPAVTALAKVAAGMTPGTWAELPTLGYTAELLKAQHHHVLQYTSAATWEPKSGQVLFVGQGHYSALKFLAYAAGTNRWTLRPTPPWWAGDPATGKGPIGHAYFNNALDAANGVLYVHQSDTRLVHRYGVAADEWTTLPEIAGAATGHGTAIAYFPERRGLVRVLGGHAHAYDETAATWSRLTTERLPMGPYHNFAQYSPAHKAVLFGGGNGSKAVYRLDAAGKVTALKPAPVEVGVNTAVVTVDPVGGELLVLHQSGRLFACDPTADAWREVPTDLPFALKGSSFDAVATPVPEHGVVLVFTGPTKGLKVWLYKPAPAKR